MADKDLDRRAGALDDTLWGHKWGFKDTRFVVRPDRSVYVTGSRYAISGPDMPDFIPFAEEMLQIKFDLADLKPERQDKPVPPPRVNPAFARALAEAFPATQVSQDDDERLLHSHGQTTADEVYKVLYGALERVADLVFYPESEADAERIVLLAQTHNVVLVPYGGGTSVSAALKLPADEDRMIVVVDMRRMNSIEWIDRENYRASVQAGITGRQLEEALAAEGFTSGHEPDSMELSTLGGWIATNASGMKKNRYGNIEDIVENITMVTPRGVVEQVVAMPRIAMGMQFQHLLFGSEGNLGLITRAVIRLYKLPEVKKYGSLVFPDFETGVAFLYALTRAGVLPASIRLVDNIQFRFGQALKPRPTQQQALIGKAQKAYLLRVKGFDPHKLCAATIVMEGSADEVAYQEKTVNRLAAQYGGVAGGAANGRRGYMLTYAIAYIRDFFIDYQILGETYETTVPWDKINDVIDAVTRMAEEKHTAYGLPGRPYVSPRITQLYHTGVCIYFTHGFSAKGVADPDRVFSAIEHSLRETIIAHGGSISHHHGVGKIRKDFMGDTVSPTTVELLKAVKQADDPDNIFGIRNNIFTE
ncbi:MAG: FAD-binding oxidoreductase [Anaerolineae bacterium]|nr:FAD-binding oxidoreductase [Anaerolineae bacterium]